MSGLVTTCAQEEGILAPGTRPVLHLGSLSHERGAVRLLRRVPDQRCNQRVLAWRRSPTAPARDPAAGRARPTSPLPSTVASASLGGARDMSWLVTRKSWATFR